MKLRLLFLSTAASFVPAVALACPYSSGQMGGCGACGSSFSLLGYGATLLVGLGIGVASVAFERRR
jgi:hypothetical protein